MITPYLWLCLALVLACTITRWFLVQELTKLRLGLAELVSERQKVINQRQQAKTILEYVEVEAMQLLNDCRDLSKALAELLARIQKLEETETRIEEARKKDMI